MDEYIFITKFPGAKHEYSANIGSIHGTGRTHTEALKALHHMINFMNGTIDNPTPLKVENMRFEDWCENPKCPCNRLKK